MDEELRRALRRVEPSADFTDRTMARLAAPGSGGVRPDRWRTSLVRWLGAGIAASVLVASGATWYQASRRSAEVEQAREDVERALRITTEKLQEVQARVQAKAVAFRDRQF